MKNKTVGGSGTGLGGDFASWLQGGLSGGGFGGKDSGGIGGLLNNILGGGAGTLGGALSTMLQTQQTNDVNSIRSRYGVGGGTGFGSPAAYGESTYRAQAAPQITSAIGNLQMGALNSILPILAGTAGKDIPQAQVQSQQNPFVQALGIAAPLLGGLASGGAFSGMFGGGAAASGGFSAAPQSFSFNSNPNLSNPFYH
jgi:hypothetical protein